MIQFIKYSYLFLCLSIFPLFGQERVELDQNDGPYVIHSGDYLKLIKVSEEGLSVQNGISKDKPFQVGSHDGKHKFEVELHSVSRPAWDYKQSGDIMIISDIHGNLDAFLSILAAQKVIGKEYQWTFGKKHLVVIGDVFDRGDDVLPIFWLIYKLEAQADRAGGKVHFLLGNHEEMILRNNVKYMTDKYVDLSKELEISYSQLWDNDSELGRWLSTRNTMERIGSNLFVHAGLSKQFLDHQWRIPEVNDTISTYLRTSKEERSKLPTAAFLFGNDGPLWYRGMVSKDDKYNPINDTDVDAILKQYDVKRIFVGHTIFDEVSSFYGDKVIDVNVNNKKNRSEERSRGILLKNNKPYLIYDNAKDNKLMLVP